jgi:hypothetical protein
MKYISTILLVLFSCTLSFAQHKWVPVGTGANNPVYAICTDTVSNVMYAGGEFTSIGGITANSIAKYNGQIWTALGTGTDGIVNTIVISGTKVYVAGYFTNAGGVSASNIAVYDTVTLTWSALGTGTDDVINSLAIYNNELYAGGWFLNAGGSSANYIAKWNGSSWSNVTGGMDDAVYALASYNNELYAGGRFLNVDGNSMNSIAKWNGTQWTNVTSGANFDVMSLHVYDNELYVGGEFDMVGDSLAYRIGKWNGTNWHPILGVVSGGPIYAIASDTSSVYLGGDITTVNGVNVKNVASWDGSTLNSLSNGLDAFVYSLNQYKQVIYAGGKFQYSGSDPNLLSYIAKWCTVTASASSNVTICAGKSTTLTASGGDTYSWSSGGTSSSIVVSPTVTTTYTATVSKKRMLRYCHGKRVC